MAIEELTRVLVAHEPPVGVPSPQQWLELETRLQVVFPGDFKDFNRTYGYGYIDHFITVYTISCNPYCDIEQELQPSIDALRVLRDEFETDVPYPLFPDKNGLFPWGRTGNGDCLYWIRSGEGFLDRVVVCDSAAMGWQEFEMSTTTFLASVLTRRVRVQCFPDTWPSLLPEFEPFRLPA